MSIGEECVQINKNNFRIYQVIISLVFISLSIIGISSFRFYLDEYAQSFSDVFRLQNTNLIETSDVFELGNRLEATKKSGSIKCIYAQTDGRMFYQYGSEKCDSGPLSKVVEITAKGRDNFSIRFEVTLPWKVQIAFIGFLFLNILVSIIAAAWIKSHENLKSKAQAELANLAKQVAHDIRSPLTSLTMIMGTIENVSEEKRVIIRNATTSINDIANDLLQKGKNLSANKIESIPDQKNEGPEKLSLNIEYIPAIVDILVTEKRMQSRVNAEIEIQTNFSEGFGCFAAIQSTELKRVLSNLINNSIEAFTNQKGNIEVGVKKVDKDGKPFVEIFVKDNGKGIPKKVINKLGEHGASFGKETSGKSGSGLGLYHAKQTAIALGGEFNIQSKENIGTTIQMLIPQAETPNWFASSINFENKKFLVTLDDDSTIHQIWAERLKGSGLNIEQIQFQSGLDFEKYVYANINKMTQTVFLVDYELLNQSRTGLDLIEELGLERHSILVTSRYDEAEIHSRAEKYRFKILPKSLAGIVPIQGA